MDGILYTYFLTYRQRLMGFLKHYYSFWLFVMHSKQRLKNVAYSNRQRFLNAVKGIFYCSDGKDSIDLKEVTMNPKRDEKKGLH